MVKIRRASIDDDSAIAALTRELGYESSPEAARRRLSRLLDSDTDAVLVADSDRAVGWVHVALVASLENDVHAEIRGLVVADGFRSKGVGAQLVAAAEDWARRRGVERVRVRSNVVRIDARRFYERLGYAVTKTSNVFDKTIGNGKV